MDYLEWNDAIAACFFRPDMAHRRVFLAVTEDVIQDIGKAHGANLDDFLSAIRTGPPWTSVEPDICRKALMAKEQWRKRVPLPSHPPYVAFLAVFVLAADHDDTFAASAYYKPLEALLAAPVNRTLFPEIYTLWLDLQKWSRDDKTGELGICRYALPKASRFVNVGLPRSQTLFLSAERKALPRFFADNHLDPTSLPSEATLLRALRPASFLRALTRHLLDKSDAPSCELHSALAEFVLDELQAWDGSVEQSTPLGTSSTRSIQTAAVLRLCLKVSTLAGRASVTARFNANRRFPDGVLKLQGAATEQVWDGWEAQEGWSRPLSRLEGTQKVTLDAATLNWAGGQTFRDSELGWRVVLPPASVRLFLPGRREGLNDDWVESLHLVPGSPFRVACHFGERAAIEAWGGQFCETFQEMALPGLPPEWMLFSAKNARSSQTEFDLLRLSQRRRLRLIGGIKAEGFHTYFHFNRPCITLEGGNGTEPITCVQNPLTGGEDGLWTFSDAAPIQTPLRVQCGDEAITLTLRPTELCLNYDAPRLNSWGALTEQGLVSGVQAPMAHIDPPPADIPTHFGGHIVFLGRRAGELADWPADPLPQAWGPAWAIVKIHKDEWRAHFVGASPDFAATRQIRQGAWKKWREIYARRTTQAVGIKRVRELWAQCCKEAKHL